MSDTDKIIQVKNLSSGYEGRPIIYDINLTVDKLDFLGVIGPNGGGKSTFIKTLLGLLKPIKGEILFYRDNKEVNSLNIGYLPQRNIIDHNFPITVFDIVLSGLP